MTTPIAARTLAAAAFLLAALSVTGAMAAPAHAAASAGKTQAASPAPILHSIGRVTLNPQPLPP